MSTTAQLAPVSRSTEYITVHIVAHRGQFAHFVLALPKERRTDVTVRYGVQYLSPLTAVVAWLVGGMQMEAENCGCRVDSSKAVTLFGSVLSYLFGLPFSGVFHRLCTNSRKEQLHFLSSSNRRLKNSL
ncbi:hypothetical protein MPTK1_3g02310 [Marchantia polymorpha subsp. ruderalis]|uniref:Uncharacterized protein n=2 Tax=Marchantia polymorpha TaxID=3197 RepID=A0AAF6AWN5_MARPO|nr:hypothetical protein MARPO_0007s0220 [Marchantia polymorpha]BBN04169.1 hypothetical protein Mp_3g02310 [Marchantia polymorpha subsp. ruderalis]|eukprot:PTQ47856.1 hypothetical protein MARPO_0007s0220 [Marchantia polymorpha]